MPGFPSPIRSIYFRPDAILRKVKSILSIAFLMMLAAQAMAITATDTYVDLSQGETYGIEYSGAIVAIVEYKDGSTTPSAAHSVTPHTSGTWSRAGNTAGTYDYYVVYYCGGSPPNSGCPTTPQPTSVSVQVVNASSGGSSSSSSSSGSSSSSSSGGLISLGDLADDLNLGEKKHELYLGDFRGDGVKEIYLRGTDRFVLLHGDVVTPIKIDPYKSALIALKSQLTVHPDCEAEAPPDSEVCWDNRIPYFSPDRVYETANLSDSDLAAASAVRLKNNKDYFVGDFNGDGKQDLFFVLSKIAGFSANETAVLFISGASSSYAGIEIDYPGRQIGEKPVNSFYAALNSEPFVVRDIDGDGRDELVKLGGEVYADAYYNVSWTHSEDDYDIQYRGDTVGLKTATLNGASAGNFRVDESGAATYSLPITLPSGTAGVTPSLSLEYSSLGGNGMPGMGWTIGGLSTVARCSETLSKDGQAKAIAWDASGKYCFNGQRLVETSGTGVGQYNGDSYNWKTYRTEMRSALRVRGYFQDADYSKPKFFTVEDKDGSISYYGGSLSSQKDSLQRVSQWSIDRTYDSAGNKIQYQYAHESGNSFRLMSISYAYGASTTPNAKVELQYASQNRPDVTGGYMAGVSVKNFKRLRRIVVKNSSGGALQEIRSYELIYRRVQADDRYSRSYLTHIQECDSSSSSAKCLPPTEFSWATGQHSREVVNKGVVSSNFSVIDNKSDLLQIIPIDVNGDSYLDLVWTENDEHDNYSFRTRVRYALYNPKTNNYFSGHFSSATGTGGEYLQFGEDVIKDKDAAVFIHALDYNGDGRQDLAILRNKTRNWEIHLSTPSFYNASMESMEWRLSKEAIPIEVNGNPHGIVMDADSDGLQDIVTNKHIYHLKRDLTQPDESSIPYKFGSVNRTPIDFDGFNQPFATFSGGYAFSTDDKPPYKEIIAAGDFNNDGVADAIIADVKLWKSSLIDTTFIYREENYYVAIRQGDKFVAQRFLGGQYDQGKTLKAAHYDLDIKLPPLLSIFVLDVNNDGYMDIIRQKQLGEEGDDDKDGFIFHLNKGDAFAGAGEIPLSSGQLLARVYDGEKVNFRQIDTNGDGYSDLQIYNSRYSQGRFEWNNSLDKFVISGNTNGSGYISITGDPYGPNNNRFMYMDVNADGYVDELVFKHDTRQFELREAVNKGPIDIVTAVKNGLGGITKIQYEKLNKTDNYIAFEQTNSQSLDAFYECIDEADGDVFNEISCEIALNNTEVFDQAAFYRLVNTPFKYLMGSSNAEILEAAKQTPTFEYIGSNWVVTEVEGSAPAGDKQNPRDVAHDAFSAVEYFYRHARYQASGLGMLGFRELMTVDKQTGIKTVTKYRQDWPFVGQPESTTSYSPAGDVMSLTNNVYGLVGWNASWDDTYVGYTSGSVNLPFQVQPYVKAQYETTHSFRSVDGASDILPNMDQVPGLQVPRKTQMVTTENKVDSYGNVYYTKIKTTGKHSTLEKVIENSYDSGHAYGSSYALGGQDIVTFLSGDTGSRSLNYRQLGRITGTKVTTTRNADAPSNYEARETHFAYYGGGTQAGLLWKEILEPNREEFKVSTTNTYDSFGNKYRTQVTAKDYRYNALGEIIPGSSLDQTRVSEFVIDPSGRYVNETRVILGSEIYSKEKIVARNKYGQPTRIKSMENDTITTVDYDLLGREVYRATNVGAGGHGSGDVSNIVANWSELEYLKCSQVSYCPPGTSYAVKSTSATGEVAIEYFDVLGRSTRKGKVGFNGQFVFVDTEYDKHGRVLRSSEPYFEGNVPSLWTATTYDVLGRVIKTVMPDGSESKVFYDHLTSTTTNALNQTHSEMKNGLGELIEVRSHDNGIVRYEYNAYSQLSKIKKIPTSADYTNHGLLYESVIELTLDAYGRKTKMVDPDKGNWHYRYNAFNELVWQKNGNNQVTIQTYDRLGRMVRRTNYFAANDPVNSTAFGEIESHTRWYYDGKTDNASTVVPFAGNAASAVVMTTDSSVETCGQGSDTSKVIQCVYPSFDEFGRAYLSETRNSDGQGGLNSYTAGVVFDGYGRTLMQTDALHGLVTQNGTTGINSGIQNSYNEHGYLKSVTDLQQGSLIYEINQVNARGQVIRDFKGNGFDGEFTYDNDTGRLLSQKAAILGSNAEYEQSTTIQKIDYDWDVLGNLKSRHNQSLMKKINQFDPHDWNDLRESFAYDNRNRLKHHYYGALDPTSNSPSSTVTMEYDSFGNLRFKTGIGTYSYGNQARSLNGAGVHAVYQAINGSTTTNYNYDANGNVILDSSGGSTRTFEYATFDKPTLISKSLSGNSHTTSFHYGVNRSRFLRKDESVTNETTITEYMGSVEKVYDPNGTEIKWKRYLGGSAVFTITTNKNTNGSGLFQQTARKDEYIYKDHLGSLDIITDHHGVIVQAMSFDAWGGRRSPEAWTEYLINKALTDFNFVEVLKQTTTRGYTGHEMLDEVGVIHMNGRIYDPKLARFLQADPILQAPTFSETHNRYSYLANNPLNATDPTGFMNPKYARHVRPAIAVVIAVVASYACGTCGPELYAAVAAGAAAAGAYINGARGEGLLFAAISGAASAYASAYMSGMNPYLVVAVNAVVGGITSVIQGGKFGHGFISSSVSSAVGPYIKTDYALMNVGVRAMIGGSISKITGGKFESGAATAAFQAVVSEGVGSGGGSQGCVEDGGSSCEAAQPEWKFQEKSKSIAVEVIENEDGSKTIYGRGTISGKGSSKAAKEINKYWGGVTLDYEGVTYHLDIQVEKVESGGDIVVQKLSRNEIIAIRKVRAENVRNNVFNCDKTVDTSQITWRNISYSGRVNAIGGDTIIRGMGRNSFYAHEFGHLLGLTHAPSDSGSIMSYDSNRAVLGRDAHNLAVGYDQ